jgi:hypothetical protein
MGKHYLPSHGTDGSVIEKIREVIESDVYIMDPKKAEKLKNLKNLLGG